MFKITGRRRCGDNIKSDLQEVGWAAGPRKRGNEQAGSISAGNLSTSGKPVSFSRGTLFPGINNIMGQHKILWSVSVAYFARSNESS
jgi:hypothetical protein